MPAMEPKVITTEEFASLSAGARKVFSEAEEACRNAVSLFDFGLARGMLLALVKVECVDLKVANAMYRRCRQVLPEEVLEMIDALPPEHRSEWSRGETYPKPWSSRKGQVRG